MSAKPLTRLFRAFEELRKLDAEMPLQTATMLLLVAEQPGISQTALLSRAGVSKAAVSRIFHRLSDRPGGLALLHMDEDPNDLRAKITHLTPKGKRVVTSLELLMES